MRFQKGHHYNLGIKRTLEQRKAMRQRNLEQFKINPNFGMTGKKHSKEARLKISLAKKGKPSIRKGMHFSEESKKLMSARRKGVYKPNKGSFQKGLIPWLTGKKMPKEFGEKISKKMKGKYAGENCTTNYY